MAKDVTILIPTYFGGTMLYNCIDSIHKSVANPKILVYKNDIGWLKAANEMFKSTTGDVILLNDDTIVLTDIVHELQAVAYSKTYEDVGMVGAKMLSPNQETVINYGIYVGKDGNTAHKHYGEHKRVVNKIEVQKAVEGSCVYIRRWVLDTFQGFDEGYGQGYREEVDLAFQVREAGGKVLSCPTAEVVHFVSQTHGKLGITNDTHKYFMEKWGTKLKLGKV